MARIKTMRRRSWLKGAATVAGAIAAPTLLLRRSHARTSVFGEAKHVLVLYARGGMRSHCLFNAVGGVQHNPYGVQPGSDGTQWKVGAVLGGGAIETASFGSVPGFTSLTHHAAVLGLVDLEPTSARPLIDHVPAVVQLGTGVEGDGQGLLSRLIEAHPRYANGIAVDNMPPVDIGNTTFGRTDTEHVPLRLPSATAAVTRRAIMPNWSSDLRDELNGVFETATPMAYADRVRRLVDAKQNAFAFSDVLIDPRLDILGAPEASHAGITNAQMLEVLGNDDLADLGDPESNQSWGPDVALALRTFAFGAPMAVVERNIYDTHSGEDESLPVRAADLTRQLAGVRFLLSQMEHPEGGTYWDKTVVTVVSEFNRNNTEQLTGYNSGTGSDHQLSGPDITRNQAVPLMGGPIERAGVGGRIFGTTDENMVPQATSTSFRSVYATLLDLLGAPHKRFWEDAPVDGLFS